MDPDLIVVADATEAHLYSREAPNGALLPLATLRHPQSRLKGSELGGERAGHDRTDQRPGGVSYEPRIDPRRKTHLQFAHELSRRIEQALLAQQYGRLVLFASSPFLGHLKENLSAAARKALGVAVDKDLTAFAGGELQARVDRALASPAAE